MKMRRKLEDRYNTELIGEIMHIAQGNEQFSIDFFDKKGGAWKRRLHYHDFYELEFVISGSAANVINGMRFELSRGMMFLIRPTDVHRYEIEPGEEISVCTVRFTSAMLDRNIVAALAGSSPLIADFSDSYDFLKALFDETRREYLERGEFSDILLSGVCERLAVMLCRKTPNTIPSSVNRIAAAAVGLINIGYSGRLTVQSAANELGVSPNYLGKVFSDSMNMTFVGYLRRVRLNYALNRIINTGDTLQRIALESGFSAQSVFTREFRKYYGRSPTEIRADRKTLETV